MGKRITLPQLKRYDVTQKVIEMLKIINADGGNYEKYVKMAKNRK